MQGQGSLLHVFHVSPVVFSHLSSELWHKLLTFTSDLCWGCSRCKQWINNYKSILHGRQQQFLNCSFTLICLCSLKKTTKKKNPSTSANMFSLMSLTEPLMSLWCCSTSNMIQQKWVISTLKKVKMGEGTFAGNLSNMLKRLTASSVNDKRLPLGGG